MARTNSSLLTRIAAPFCKFTLALGAALGIASAVYAENYWWTGSGTDTNYDTPANWGSENGSTYPGSDDGAIFNGAAVEKTVTFNGAYTPAWIWVATDDVTKPVTWAATAGGSASTTFNIGLADASGQVGALVVESGTYTAAGGFNVGSGQAAFEMTGGTITANGVSQWAYAANAALTADIKGGTLNFDGVDGNDGLRMMYGTGISNVITVSNATFAVNNGDLVIGVDADATSSTTINIDQDGVVSCGTPSLHRWLKMNSLGKVTINVNEGGTLAVWHIAHDAAGECKINLNGGKLKVLGGAGAGVIGVENDASLIVTVGEKGGTLEVPTGVSASVLKNLKGEGTLTVTGGGSATFAPQGNTCQIVANGATVLTNVDNYWNAGGGVDTDWNTSSNWDTGLGGALNAVFHSAYLNGAETTATFAGAYSYQAGLWIENGLDGIVTFSKAESAVDTAGLAVANNITIGTATSGALKIASGTYSVNGSLFVGYSTGSASLTMEDGTVSVVGDFDVGINAATSTFTMNGGTISAAGTGWWGADNAKTDVTINDGTLAFTSTGWLIFLNNTTAAAAYITNNVTGGTVSAPVTSFRGSAGTATINLTDDGTFETGNFAVEGTATYAINLSGGTLKAATDNVTFIPASDKLTVAVDGNVTLNTNGKTITIDAAMLGDGTLTCVGGGTVTFTSLDSTCNIVQADDGTTVNKPSVNYWVGGASGSWNDDANWSSGEVPTNLAIFTNTVTVTVGATYSIESLYPAENVVVTLTGGGMLSGIRNLGELATEGDKIVLDGVSLESVSLAAGYSTAWYADIEISAETTSYIYCYNADNGSGIAHLDLYGNMFGKGTVHLTHDGNGSGRGGVSLYGNNEEFEGVCYIHSGALTRGPATFCSEVAGSAKAKWLYVDGVQQNTSAEAGSANVTDWSQSAVIKFGTYEGLSYIFGFDNPIADGLTIEIGGAGRGSDFECGLSAKCRTNADRGHKNITLEKTGDGVMTFKNDLGQPYVSTWKLSGGTLRFANSTITNTFDAGGYSGGTRKNATFVFTGGAIAFTDDAMVDGNLVDISSLIKNSSDAISVYVDTYQSLTWATALNSSNKGGLIKDGAGTLTLGAIPQYDGTTIVKAGKLIVPFGTQFDALVLEGDATIEVDMSTAVDNAIAFSSGTFSGDTNGIKLMDNAPAGYSGAVLVVSDGVVVYANGSKTFTWVGPSGDSGDHSWTNPDNWTVDGTAALAAPAAMDTVVFDSPVPGVTVGSAVTALSMRAPNGLTLNVDYDVTIQASAQINGELVKAGNGALKVLGGIADSLTAVTIKGGSVESEIGSNVSIAFTPDVLTSANYSAANGAKIVLSSDRTFTDLSGSGKIVTEGDLTLKSDNDTSFTGSISGSTGLTKTGTGSLTLVGSNSFSGDVNIEKGTLKIGGVSSMDGVRYDLDASAESAFSRDGNGNITGWKSVVGDWAFNYNDVNANTYITSDSTTLLGGRQAASFQPDYESTRFAWYTSSKKTDGHAESIFIACEVDGSINTSSFLWGQNNSNTRVIQYRYSNSTWYWPGNKNLGGFYRDGTVNSGIVKGDPALYAALDCSMLQDNQTEALGCTVSSYTTGSGDNQKTVDAYGFKGLVGEVVAFDRKLTTEERQAVEAYLMGKWSINNAPEYTVIPATADVTMKSGATLDMGGLTQTVTSFTGAGTVTNGYLKTTGDLTVDGGTLTIQATAGQTYVLSDVEAERLVLTGTAKDYTIKVPDNCRIVGRFVVPEGISVGFEGEGADVTVVNVPKGWEITSKHITGGILYRVGSFPFKLILR